jgi:hypothetical protein
MGDSVAAAVGYADMHMLDAGLFQDFTRASLQGDNRRSTLPVSHFNVAPSDTSTPPGSKGLEHRFFGGPAAGIVLSCRLLGRAIGDFMFGINPVDEQFAMSFDHLSYAQALDDVSPNA